ncbi:DNA repair protein RadC [bacterium]|nr:DNA repair protein RadC [bacterium]
MVINLLPSKIKDIERLQSYERIFQWLLKSEGFSKQEICKSGESKYLIGKTINSLLTEGAIEKKTKDSYQWTSPFIESYRKEWLHVQRPSHQLKRLKKTDRPREKLLAFGPGKLTTSELLAIFLRTGIRGKSVIKIASELLTQFGGVKGIFEADKEELFKVEGIGEAKVAQIKAVHGLAEKYLKEKAKLAPIMKKSKEAFDYLYLSMRDLKQETFKVIFLDSANQVIDMKNLFKGTLTSSAVYPREIMKKAIEYNAAGLIFVHNHPSGDSRPSQSDREITETLVSAGNIMQIKVLDHIIIGDNRYFSFADEGLIRLRKKE